MALCFVYFIINLNKLINKTKTAIPPTNHNNDDAMSGGIAANGISINGGSVIEIHLTILFSIITSTELKGANRAQRNWRPF